MPIYHYPLGAHLKVHSFSNIPPTARPQASPAALILICHGIYQQGTATINVPANIPSLHLAVPHGQPNENATYKWFQDLITEGVASALRYDFKYPAAAGTPIVNYFLGKGEPDKSKGDAPAAWFGYDKEDRLSHPNSYNPRNVGEVGIISSSYVENIMRFAEQKQMTSVFDFATVKRSCRNLQDVFDSMMTAPAAPRYDYLLCAFCRELVS